MSFLRNVIHDLVEKKLWPVALALVAALVAIPVALGGSGSDSGAAPAAPSGAAPSAGVLGARDVARAEVVSLDEQAATGIKIRRAGRTRNPFAQHHVPKSSDALTQAIADAKNLVTGGGSGGNQGTAGSGGSGSGSGGSSVTLTPVPQTPAATKPKTSSEDTYRVTLKFGENGAERTIDDVARLTPLPSSTNPFFVFLGLKDDAKTAVFLVSSDAVPTGDGTCKPTNEDCETVELKPGDIEFFDLQSGTAGVVQYQLELVKISKGKAKTKAAAARAHARESRAGRDALRAVVATNPSVLEGWDFSSSLGLLVSREPAAGVDGDVAHVPADVAAAAQGEPATTTP